MFSNYYGFNIKCKDSNDGSSDIYKKEIQIPIIVSFQYKKLNNSISKKLAEIYKKFEKLIIMKQGGLVEMLI
jgi:hypothetical protein